jgi:spore coat polysaccharide biosynthesis predicted glycosyltransferase SpsG
MKLSLKVLLYLDYDEQSGLGHISRSRAIIETLSSFTNKIYISSKMNPLDVEPQIGFLNEVKWISYEEAELIHFDLVYVDTYIFEIISKVEHLNIERKILLIDSNYTQKLPSWPDMIIDLEQITPRNCNFRGTYLFGDILVHSELEFTKQTRKNHGVRKSVPSNLTVVVNFGGSIKIETYLRQLGLTFLNNREIHYIIYSPHSLIERLKKYFQNYKNVEIKRFSPNYLNDLAMCDFLVTNSGTSFIEGLYIDVPMVVFNLFPNAELNFEKLRYSRQVIYSGLTNELESSWQSDVLKSFQSRSKSSNFKSNDDLKIEILGGGIIKSALNGLGLTELP